MRCITRTCLTFRHVPFEAPYTPERYTAAFQHCVSKGAKVIICDSFSHVWEGTGGVLEAHDIELERLSKGDVDRAEKMSFTAWIKPKAAHRRMINAMLAMPVSFIIALRAKEKMRIVKGKPPEPRGWMPIASDELVFELTLKCLLLPGSDGVPTWQPKHEDEKQLIKLPQQFREMFTKREQLSEDIGEQLARWAAGTPPPAPPTTELVARYAMCEDPETLSTLENARSVLWPTLSKDEKTALKLAVDAAKQRLAAAQGEPGGTA